MQSHPQSQSSPTNPYFNPSAPSLVAPTPSYNQNPYVMAAPPQLQPSPTPHLQNNPQQGIGVINVPPMMYSVPGTVQMQPIPASLLPPTAALKPIPQPPPAPALNEVILNEERVRVRCPYCYASVTTKINYSTGTMTHIAAFAVFVVCCPMFWFPYIVDCCKDVDHACPNCGRNIGRFRRFV